MQDEVIRDFKKDVVLHQQVLARLDGKLCVAMQQVEGDFVVAVRNDFFYRSSRMLVFVTPILRS
jgi:hypothetical protein